MSKKLGEQELYELARGVVGERCASLEGAFRTPPGGRLVYPGDPLARALEKEAGKDLPTLTEPEHAGMLALASLEWFFEVRGRPWLDPDSASSSHEGIERCSRHLRGILRYLSPQNAEKAWRFAEGPEAWLEQQRQHVDSPQSQQDQPAGSQPTTTTEVAAPKDMKSDAVGVGGGRRDLLAPAIEAAKRACSDPTDSVQVWLELRAMAERRVQPLRGTTEDGIQWVDSSDAPKTLKIGALRDRIRRASTR